ncbi:hypothetical protein [Actinoplanes sp. L3-i22]|uniref:hypothetical protein n=1 Tax=Actinoplanes sp. L3-i22 TaxID=2836373 RepID=UPI001C77644E|nr:hypothetical protein [Actinoplanes sp. L3-i22]BCY13531.1 hypothetical protein L3i22_086190 [Actinoplanes sp. L3-i22]
MTFPNSAQGGGPRPGPPQGGFRPGPPMGGARPAPSPGGFRPEPPGAGSGDFTPAEHYRTGEDGMVVETGHPAVDAVLSSLANAARLAPAEQIAEYEAAHQVLQETLAGIDR